MSRHSTGRSYQGSGGFLHLPKRAGNHFFLSTKGPASVQVPPGTRMETERPSQQPSGSTFCSSSIPFASETRFPNNPWPHGSLNEALPSACTHSTFLSLDSRGLYVTHPLLPLPFNPLRGNSVMHIAWNEDHRLGLYKLLTENLVRSGRTRQRGENNNPWQDPLITVNSNAPSQKGGTHFISATQESFLPAERTWGLRLWDTVPDNQKMLQGCS